MAKYRAEITKGEELRYLSHLDYARVFERAIRRAGLPAAYSEGFNPHMKLAFASALAVGITSSAEYMDFELVKPLAPKPVMEALVDSLPPGAAIKRLRTLPGKVPSLMSVADEAGYDIYIPYSGDFNAVENAVCEFNQAAEVVFHRVTPKKNREIEVKQYVTKPIEVTGVPGGVKLKLYIGITNTGSVKSMEIIKILSEQFGAGLAVEKAIINRSSLTSKGKALIDLD